MSFLTILFILFIIFSSIPKNKRYKKLKSKRKLFKQKILTRKQKYNLVRQELSLKRNSKKIPKNDVMWGVYQMELVEYFAKEFWLDYGKTLDNMANLLYDEKKYRGALENYLKALCIDMCIPFYDETGDYPTQTFCSRKVVLEMKRCRFYTAFFDCIEELNLNKEQLKCIFMDIKINEVPLPISQEEAWDILISELDKEYKF